MLLMLGPGGVEVTLGGSSSVSGSEHLQPIVVPRDDDQASAARRAHRSYLANLPFQRDAALVHPDSGEPAFAISAQQQSITRVIPPFRGRHAVEVPCHQDVGASIAIEVLRETRVDRRE